MSSVVGLLCNWHHMAIKSIHQDNAHLWCSLYQFDNRGNFHINIVVKDILKTTKKHFINHFTVTMHFYHPTSSSSLLYFDLQATKNCKMQIINYNFSVVLFSSVFVRLCNSVSSTDAINHFLIFQPLLFLFLIYFYQNWQFNNI